MSICSTAVGVLWFIAILHIVLSGVLGALIVGVCYYGKRKERETRHKVHISQDSACRARSRDLQALESPDKLYLSNPKQLGSRPDSPPLDEPNTQETVVKDDLGLYTVETEIGKRVSFERPSSSNPSVEEVEQVELRKRSRVSIISNISNRFRKSMDLDSSTKEDALRLVRERSSSSSEREPTATYLMEDQLVANPTEVEAIVSSDVISPDNGQVIINQDAVEIVMSNNESEC
ncbi:uncharacterized protein LOC135331385 [Halichondria panicea]|uniref:uncharacterized protein LOC135331385 n=1 Tax=Halichondria panicea TaxID=6063 RepID=UPI00312B79E8